MTTGKKRVNSEGRLRKHPDGRWEGRYTAGRDPVTGKAIYKNVLAKTQKECREKLAQAIEKSGKINVTKAGQYTGGVVLALARELLQACRQRQHSGILPQLH